MICIVIKGPTLEEAIDQLTQALLQANMIELRLDLFSIIDLESLKILRAICHLPMIFTLRSPLQGGSYNQSEEKRLTTLLSFLEAKPDYIDIEWDVSETFIYRILQDDPHMRFIISHHEMMRTPSNEELDLLYINMQKIPAHVYKIAVMASTLLDTLRFLCWKKEQNTLLIGICMGSHGEISRILSPVFGNPFTYTTLHDTQKTVEGQLTVDTLTQIYRYFSLNRQTQLYGLIGYPVHNSVGEITHNDFFQRANLNAVYVKMEVKEEELEEFLKYAKMLPFLGISVTMPLKEAICDYIEEIDSEAKAIGAVNTLVLQEGEWKGFNTDGRGAVNAIEKHKKIKNQRVIIIGAGGAAKSIAYEAHKRGADVILFNRNDARAQESAREIGCRTGKMQEIQEFLERDYAVLINCTPIETPIPIHALMPKKIVMDINTKRIISPFFSSALEKGCTLVYGYEMFVEQALGQFRIWEFDSQLIQHHASDLKEKAKSCLGL